MTLRTTLLSAAFIAAMLLTASQPALAEHGERGWHGDIRHFDAHDMHRWHNGRWVHGRHGAYRGWWWVVAGMWYFYPAPVYPYPDPYAPPVVVDPQPPVLIQQAPPAAAPRTRQFWYYCEPAGAYYPYVASCPTEWKKVPATPPGAP